MDQGRNDLSLKHFLYSLGRAQCSLALGPLYISELGTQDTSCLLAPAAVLKIHTEVGTLIYFIFAVSLQVWAQGGW